MAFRCVDALKRRRMVFWSSVKTSIVSPSTILMTLNVAGSVTPSAALSGSGDSVAVSTGAGASWGAVATSCGASNEKRHHQHRRNHGDDSDHHPVPVWWFVVRWFARCFIRICWHSLQFNLIGASVLFSPSLQFRLSHLPVNESQCRPLKKLAPGPSSVLWRHDIKCAKDN